MKTARSQAAEAAQPRAAEAAQPRAAVAANPPIPAFRIGAVDDAAEHQADAVAARVLGGTLRRSCAACEDDRRLHRRASASPAIAGDAPQAVARAVASGGTPLPAAEATFFGPRMGADLSGVRLHHGPAADAAARSVGARAFALGRDIVFAKGEYAPQSPAGRHLLAHELAHVVQASPRTLRRLLGPPPPGAETVTRQVAEEAIRRAVAREGTRQVARRAGWRVFWRVVARRFAVRGAAMLVLSAADGPLPIGELISLGLALWTIYEIARLWDMLWQEAQREVEVQPQPELAPIPAPAPRPRPAPDTDTDEDEPRRCREMATGQRGGNTCHDAFATALSGSPREWGVETPEGLFADFDGRTIDGTLIEAKTGYGWLLNTSRRDPAFVAMQVAVRHRWVEQSEHQLAIAGRCGYRLLWVFNNPAVAEHADGFIRPPVTSRRFNCDEDGERGQLASGRR